jgi:HTH-type transcriptional regulator / antitoxin HipB
MELPEQEDLPANLPRRVILPVRDDRTGMGTQGDVIFPNGKMAHLQRRRIRTPVELGTLVRRQRKRLALTQVELAELTRSGPRFVAELERGKSGLQLGKVLTVLAVLGIGVDLELLEEDE